MFNKYGYVRVGAVVPSMKVADVEYNVKMIVKALENCIQKGIQIVSFPELSITGYTCQDLFFNEDLLCASRHAIRELCAWSQNKDIVFIVGSPLSENGKLYNTAVVIQNGKILGIVPKRYLPNRCEFYEARWFSILDEPTTGLHMYDIKKLINILNRLVEAGNTVVVIEHNLDVIKSADYIIDLGPEGGDGGGTVVAQGTPEEVAKNKNSFTGLYLNKMLNN